MQAHSKHQTTHDARTKGGHVSHTGHQTSDGHYGRFAHRPASMTGSSLRKV